MGRRRRTLAPGEVPSKLRWRPRLRVLGLISGAIGGLGAVVLVQQYGIAPLSRALSLQGLTGGLLSGVVIPSAIYAVVVKLHNRRLAGYLELMAASKAGASVVAAGITFVVLSAGGVLLDAARADAVLDGTCEAVFNGEDVRALPLDADGAIEVGIDDSLDAVMSAESDIVAYRFWIDYAGFSITIAEDDDATDGDRDAGGGIVEESVPVEDLAWMGAGLYQMSGEGTTARGEVCTGSFYFDVDVPPLETVVGQAAAAAAAIGVVGTAISAVGAVREGASTLGELGEILDQLGLPGGDGPGGGAPPPPVAPDGPPHGGEPPPPPPPPLDHGPTDELPSDLGRAPVEPGPPEPGPAEPPPIADPPADAPVDVAPDDVVPTAGSVATAAAVAAAGEAVRSTPPAPAATGWDGSSADGSDFLGRDTADAVASTAAALGDAKDRLEGWVDDLDVPDDVKDGLKDDLQLERIGGHLEDLGGKAETFRDTVDQAGAIVDDTTRRLDRLGIPPRLQDGIIWMRWMTEGVTHHVGEAVDAYLAPVTEPIARLFGGEASDYSQAAVPVDEAGGEMSEFLVRAAENVRGGDNYGGQMLENQDLDLDEIFGGRF